MAHLDGWMGSRFLNVALAYNPHVVIMELGTGDTYGALQNKSKLSQRKEEFIARYKELIDSFANLETHPRIWLCTDVAVGGPNELGLTNPILEEDLIPLLRQVAKEKKVGLIDVYRATVDRPELFAQNGYDENVEGAKVHAQTVYKALTDEEPPAP